MKLILAACAVFVLVTPILAPIHLDAAQSEPHRIEILAKRFAYTPDTITLKKGELVKLVIQSEDVPHGLKIEELGVDMKVSKNQKSELEFTPDKAGDFVGHCSVFCGKGHGSMELTIHVVE